MKKFFQKIIYRTYLFFAGLFWGMRAADDEIFVQYDNGSDTGINSEQQKHTTGVAGALLRGEVTQQVKELRYRTYKVDRESKKYKYYSPTLALRRDKLDTKFISYENSDNLEVVVVQPNDIYRSNIAEINTDETTDAKKNVQLHGAHLDKPKNVIKIGRSEDFTPRYLLEDYTKRVVVRRKDDKTCVVDFYVSKYPDNTKFKSKGFVKEIEKLIEDPRRNDINDIKSLYFKTYKAFGTEDLCEYEYNKFKFQGVVEYDGMYLLRYEATPTIDGVDLVMTKYFDPIMEAKYEKKEKKDIILNPFEIHERRIYTCEECGKQICYDTEAIEAMLPSQARYADEEAKKSDMEAIEFMDAQIAKVTFGKYLCKDCLQSYLNISKENNEREQE